MEFYFADDGTLMVCDSQYTQGGTTFISMRKVDMSQMDKQFSDSEKGTWKATGPFQNEWSETEGPATLLIGENNEVTYSLYVDKWTEFENVKVTFTYLDGRYEGTYNDPEGNFLRTVLIRVNEDGTLEYSDSYYTSGEFFALVKQ